MLAFGSMFESLDDEPRNRMEINPTVVVALILGGFAYVLWPLFGTANDGKLALVLVSGSIFGMSGRWGESTGRVFWSASGILLLLNFGLFYVGHRIAIPHLYWRPVAFLIPIDAVVNYGLLKLIERPLFKSTRHP